MITLKTINRLTGRKFELFTGHLLSLLNYKDVHVTKPSDDHGLDVIASTRAGKSLGIQCKHVFGDRKIGYNAIEQTFAGKGYYRTDIGILLTNGYMTKDAIRGARKLHIVCWDARNLRTLIDIANNFHSDAVALPKIHPVHRLSRTDKVVINYLLNDLRQNKALRSCQQIELNTSSLIWLEHLLIVNGIKKCSITDLLGSLAFLQQHFMIRYQQFNGKRIYGVAFDNMASTQGQNTHVFLHCSRNLIKALKHYNSNRKLIKHGSYILSNSQFKAHVLRLG